jgi:hypothetical protein
MLQNIYRDVGDVINTSEVINFDDVIKSGNVIKVDEVINFDDAVHTFRRKINLFIEVLNELRLFIDKK